MSVAHVEVLVEEPSVEAALRALLPRLLGDVSFEIYPHQGKHDRNFSPDQNTSRSFQVLRGALREMARA